MKIQMLAQNVLHLVTGKGGVGKSTFAAALVHKLSQENRGPVLLLEVQGSGRSLQLCGWKRPTFDTHALVDLNQVWGAHLRPRETFKQYFQRLMYIGGEESILGLATASLRDRIMNLVFENRIVSAFVDVCPGLEPAVLLGKIHFEADQGLRPESSERWRHVIVDAPSTGHFLQLLHSVHGIRQVFSKGIVHQQANQILEFIENPHKAALHIVTTPEELPLQESLELANKAGDLNLKNLRFWINRIPYPKTWSPQQHLHKFEEMGALFPEWAREFTFESRLWQDTQQMTTEFEQNAAQYGHCRYLPEIYAHDQKTFLARLAQEIGEL